MTWTIDQIRNQFLIISQPRAGTQMLERALSAHPDVAMRTWSTSQDTPHPIMGLYGFRQIDKAETRRPFRGTVTHMWGEDFTRKEYGIALDQYWQTVSYFFPVDRVVVLTRRNQLRRFLPYKVCELLGDWGVYKPRKEHPLVEFDFDEFLAWLHDTAVYRQAVNRAFPMAFKIDFEAIAGSWGFVIWGHLLHALGIPYADFNLCTCRQEFRPVGGIIDLTDDLRRRFEHYGMEAWLV